MKILLNNLVNELEEKINKIKEILKRLDLCIDEKVIFIYLRQNRVYRDKKIAKERRRARKAKRGRATPIFCSERTIIRPRGQNAYQRDRGLQEQTKNSI